MGAHAEPEPELPASLLWIWRAWWRLSDDRPWVPQGMEAARPGRIPWTAVAAWCDRNGYGPDDEDLLEKGLAAMDAEWLAWHAEQRRQASRGR